MRGFPERSRKNRMNGEKSRAKEHHDFFVADSTGRGNEDVVGEG